MSSQISLYAHIQKHAVEAAEKTAAFIRSQVQTRSISHKGTANLVTDTDVAAEKMLKDSLSEVVPGAEFLGEESFSQEQINSISQHKALWILDPIDGTNNFAHSFPHCSISIGYLEHGEVKVGVVYDIFRQEAIWAIQGNGTHIGGQRVYASQTQTLQEALLCTGFYYDRGKIMNDTLDRIKDLFTHGIHGIRRTGSAALDIAYVASGRLDGFFEYKLSPWDFSAGILLLQEAGATGTDQFGKPLSIESDSVICATPKVFGKFFSLVGKADKP